MRKRIAILISVLFAFALGVARSQNNVRQYQSAFMRVEIAQEQPAFVALAVDSLGKSKLSVSALRSPDKPQRAYQLHRVGSTFEYRTLGTPVAAPPEWSFEFSDQRIHLRSHFAGGDPPPPVVLNFNSQINHATLLGLINDDGSVRLPALLHLPDQGTFRITSSPAKGVALGYDAFGAL